MSPRASRGTVSRRYGKYGAKRTEYRGVVYASKLEASYAETLYRRAWNGEILMAEPQVRFPLVVNGILICTYVADFLVTNKDGSKEVHETKGRFAPGSKPKLKLFEALHKDIPLKVIGAKYKSVWDKPKRGKK